MLQVSDSEIKNRFKLDNPWWEEGASFRSGHKHRRIYFEQFVDLVTTPVKRAVILMGPRRVGKTVLLMQVVEHLLESGVDSTKIFYASIDHPSYVGLPLEKLLRLFDEIYAHDRSAKRYILFDEIQYLTDWEIHLKSLVDSYPNVRFIASGSAAAALSMKSVESGAGRFTDFLLPPLTFIEYMDFQKLGPKTIEIKILNQMFIDYLNYGGFPEAVFNTHIRENMPRFVGSDIVDKVLLRDLPSLYGIADTRELNRFFQTIAYNTGQEVNIDALSNASGVAKQTVKKYLEYLEAAFLIRRIYKVDQNARRFKRITSFKVYLTNASLRTALFGPMSDTDSGCCALTETAIFSNLMHSRIIDQIYYARWPHGEVDMIALDMLKQKPLLACEIKWSDRISKNHDELKNLISFAKKNKIEHVTLLTKSVTKIIKVDGIEVVCRPISRYCLILNEVLVVDDLKEGIHPADPIS